MTILNSEHSDPSSLEWEPNGLPQFDKNTRKKENNWKQSWNHPRQRSINNWQTRLLQAQRARWWHAYKKRSSSLAQACQSSVFNNERRKFSLLLHYSSEQGTSRWFSLTLLDYWPFTPRSFRCFNLEPPLYDLIVSIHQISSSPSYCTLSMKQFFLIFVTFLFILLVLVQKSLRCAYSTTFSCCSHFLLVELRNKHVGIDPGRRKPWYTQFLHRTLQTRPVMAASLTCIFKS